MSFAYFIDHCDEPGCDLGQVKYDCPHCLKAVSDYEVWWERMDVYYRDVPFRCAECGGDLLMVNDDGDVVVLSQ